MSLLTTEQVALWARVPVGTVYRWASQGRITRRGCHGRKALYDLEEVQAWLDTRRAAA